MQALTTPTTARRTISRVTMLIASAIMLAACGRDISAPSTQSAIAPTGASKALVGIVDGVYTFTVDPNSSYTVPLGKSYLSLPARSICDLQSSNYGSQYWNSPCYPETSRVTITAIVRGAGTDSPSIEFQPALRFNPNTNVNLFIYVTNAATLSNMTVMKYCAGSTLWSCVDESQSDQSLKTTVDASQNLVWRRIKHFSGYLIAE
jgi:hypothetical protein